MKRLNRTVLTTLGLGAGLGFFAGACGGGGDGTPGAGGSAAGTGGTTITTGGNGTSGGSGGGAPVGGGGTVGGSANSGGTGNPNGGSVGTDGGSDSGGGANPSGGDGSGTGGGPAVPEPTLITTGDGAGNQWKVGTLTEGGTAATVTVTATENQEWHGFGGTFNEAGWDALLELSEADRALAIKLLFSKTEGAGFDWGRIPIGASDYAITRYTLCDAPCNATNLETSFSIEHDRALLLPFIKASQAIRNDIKFWGSAWTPPPWMKDNNEYDKGSMKNDPANLAAYALYLRKWVDAYAAEQIPMYAIVPQNEPGWQQAYPSCAWGPYEEMQTLPAFMGTFVENQMKTAFEGSSTQLWYGTLSNGDVVDEYWANVTTAGRALIKGVGLQWENVAHVQEIASSAPNLLIMQSEHKCGNYPWGKGSGIPAYVTHKENQTANENAPNDYNYGRETWDLIKQWIELGVHIYSAWNMVLDQSGKNLDDQRIWHQNALLVVNRTAKTLTASPAYYVFRHVAQYVDVGAKRLTVNGGSALAFKNPDGDIVVIAYNSGSAAADTVVSVGGKMYTVNIPATGWATLNVKAS
jgi:glucosylceramidase